ncbi:hypothetical protein NHJ13051_002979 [Beauveria bassiana]
MSFSIFQLPQELYDGIVEQLCHRDLIRLSSTCKTYRAHLAPFVFHTIRFGNDERTSDSALAAAKTHGDHVRRLCFTYWAEPESDIEPGEKPPVLKSRALLPASRQLLEGCATSKADEVHLWLSINGMESDNFEKWNDPLCLLSYIEHSIETRDAEKRYRWRAVLNETYQAIAKNTIVRRINFSDVIALTVTAFNTRRFSELLGRLTSASISIIDPTFCWANNATDIPGYRRFITRMPEIFFRHMHQLTHLMLGVVQCYPLGDREPNGINFPLRPGSLPLLQSLQINHSFVCPELVEFIADHAKTLTCLILVDCVSKYEAAAGGVIPEPSETWALFFSQITAFQPSALVYFSVEYVHKRLVEFRREEGDIFDNSLARRIERTEEAQVSQSLAVDPERKIFAYMGLDSQMTMTTNESVNRAQALRREDYYEYQRLMRLVKENARRVTRGRNQRSTV